MSGVSMPGAELYYFPGGGNSVTFITPGGIDCIAGRLAYSDLSGMFSMVWDEAVHGRSAREAGRRRGATRRTGRGRTP